VLNRPAMPRDAGPDVVGRAIELQQYQSRMSEDADDRRRQRSQQYAIASGERRWQWPVFGACPVVAGAKDYGCEMRDVFGGSRPPSGQPDFDRGAARLVNTVQARRQGRCVIGDHEIARLEQIDEIVAPEVREFSVCADGQQLRFRWTLNRS